MRSLGGWLIILAVGAGMYYAYYVTQASGSSIGEYPLQVEGGEYTLEASVRTIGSSVNLAEASLELRRNVAGFSPRLLAGLGGIALVGVILAVVGRKKPE